MHIKKQTVIPANFKITRIPASDGKARSVYSLEKEQERALERQAANAELEAKFKEARAAGFSVVEAALAASGKM